MVFTLAVEFRDHHLRIRSPEADAAGKRFPSAGVERNGSCGFRHSVGFKEPYAGALFETLANGLWQHRTAGNRHADRAQVAVSNRHFGEGSNGSGHASDDSRSKFLNDAPVVLDDLGHPKAIRRWDDQVAACG